MTSSVWITGSVRSGKTTQLVNQYQAWIGESAAYSSARPRVGQQVAQSTLVFAANAGNRIELANRITAVSGQFPTTTTPLGFFEDEVVLFWPLLIQSLNLNARFPLRLRPETEQELAMQLWHQDLDAGLLQAGVSTQRQVRQGLDLLQVAAFSGTPLEEVPSMLQAGLPTDDPGIWDRFGALLLRWRAWCLDQGLLTYGILSELYWRHLLPHPAYRQQLRRRYRWVMADDVDNYPAIARSLFEVLLDQGAVGAFAHNPEGGIRLGLGADPQHMAGLRERCRVKHLEHSAVPCLVQAIGMPVEELFSPVLSLPDALQSIQTGSRAQLLRQTGEVIAKAVHAGEVAAAEIAVIGPGLDAIARYTLIEILARKGIAVQSLNDQRPLASSPMIRALLTVLALVYPGLGHLVNQDDVAEMLVVLSRQRFNPVVEAHQQANPAIDPVRAGLLADYCFKPHPENPCLLSASTFSRWDRLGYQAKTAYDAILQWLDAQRSQQEQRLTPNAIAVLDRAIQQFLWPHNLAYDQLAALRELMETAQHYWEVDARRRQCQPGAPMTSPVEAFIRLLRRGTITANPFPVRAIGRQPQAVTLATTFQYRSVRQAHRWHFWLDIGSSLWQGGGAVVLLGAPVFLKNWSGQAWTTEATLQAGQEQLRRLLLDLLSRVEERVYLCHSDLSVSGQEQTGPLLPLVDASVPLMTV